ncbi:MAG: hypothetical protein KF902_03540 [Phycisphaeraceae bacterium]|nr:hypothetical protein [Phycisphaeraceae bacterium]
MLGSTGHSASPRHLRVLMSKDAQGMKAMKEFARLSLVVSCVLLTGSMTACKEGESAGDATKRVVDGAAQKTGDALGSAGNAVKDAGAAVADKAGEAVDAVSEAALKAKDATIKAAEEKLAEVKPLVDGWAKKASEATGLEKPVMDNLVKGVKDNVAGVESKLGELKNAAADKWEPLSKELGTALSGLENAVKAAASKFGR